MPYAASCKAASFHPCKLHSPVRAFPSILQVTRIGDLCISPFAMDATCRVASWQQQAAGYPDACSMPQQAVGPAEERLLGKCLFASAHRGSLELTAALQTAAAAAAGAYPAK